MSEQEKNIVSYNCKSCGGPLEYIPGQSLLQCPYCGAAEEIASDGNIAERDFLSQAAGARAWDGAVVYECKNCGCGSVFDGGEISHVCPFCGTPNILETKNLPGLKPDSILPFKLTKEQADKIFKAWIKALKFSPSALKTAADADFYKGVYLPLWTFDDNAHFEYRGELGKDYTVTVGSGKNKRVERRTKYFGISGASAEFFDDICVRASGLVPEKSLDKIAPFDVKTAVKYDQKFLVGLSAVRCSKDINAAWTEAKQKINELLRRHILSRYDYDRVVSLEVNTRHINVTFKYMLMPVWTSAFKHKDKLYNFYINGTNGKITGKRPYSASKILAAAGIGLAIAAAVAVIIGKLTGAF
ncbi:MAG: hypothetical protein LBQ40_00960 [Clostridiales bacterium]|jgi:LSD1 subclass zinc finger protein|nr:hypothetical protein [Clostridiales bacterium]